MSISPNSDYLVDLFPGLYYVIPCLRPRQLSIESTQIRFDEPMDAMLWFLELLSSEADQVFYPKASLKKLVARWYGKECERSFERFYKQLHEKGLIRPKARPKAGQRGAHPHVVAITQSGRNLLSQIKEQRKQHIEIFHNQLELLPPKKKKIVLEWLRDSASAGIAAMVQHGEQLTNENTTGSPLTMNAISPMVRKARVRGRVARQRLRQ